MKKCKVMIWSVGMVIAAALTVHADDNSWITSDDGFWHDVANWSLSVPPTNTQSGIFIDNDTTKTVTINATTAGSHPGTMTISNLIMSAPAGTTNTLFLNNAGTTTPLRILDNFALGANSALLATNSAVVFDNVTGSGGFNLDGAAELRDGALVVTTNMETVVGADAGGVLTFSGGTLRARGVVVGIASGSHGVLTVDAGTAEFGSFLFVGHDPDATGTVSVTGGTLLVTNYVIVVGREGSGSMDVSGAANVEAKAFALAEMGGGRGTLTVSGGALRVSEVLQTAVSGHGTMIVANGLVEANGINVSQAAGSSSELKVGGGEVRLGTQGLLVSAEAGATGSVWLSGGRLYSSNDNVYVGYFGEGSMSVSNGQLDALGLIVGLVPGAVGTLTVAGGNVNAVSSLLSVGNDEGTTGTVWVTGGTLLMPNPQQYIGNYGVGRMTVSNGTVSAQSMIVGLHTNAQGRLAIAGGTLTMQSFLGVGWDTNSVGQLFVSGGQLICSNLYAGYYGNGTITISGGSVPITGFLSIGRYASATGGVWLTGGTLTTANYGLDSRIGRDGVGQVTVSNGTFAVPALSVGYSIGARGALTVNGGTASVWSNLTIGVAGCGATGLVTVAGGNLYVTNAAATSVLEVRAGTLTLSGGLLRVDHFVMTNACGQFVRTGGTLVYGNAVLDPARDDDNDGIPNISDLDPLDPTDAAKDYDGDGFTNLQEYLAGTDPTNSASAFRVTSVGREGNNLRITWTTGVGKTNALQAASGVSAGYADVFTVTNAVGTLTNYLDLGAATNFPSRFYRVRIVP